jgi:hypothetical protein
VDEPEGFWVRVPSDGRVFTVGMRIRLGKNGDGDTIIPDPDGDLVVVSCETGFFGGTRSGLVLQLTRYLSG